MLGIDLLDGQEVLGAAYAYSGFPSSAGAEQFDDLDVSLLGGDIEVITDGLQLPLIDEGTNSGLLELGNVGALSSYALASGPASAVASSGVISEDGSIAFDADQEPPSDAGTATVDVSALLTSLGIDGLTSDIVDELELELGAVASYAEETDDVFTSDYRVSDLTLDVHSNVVGDLSTELRDGLGSIAGDLTTDVNGLLGVADGLIGTPSITIPGLTAVTLGDPTIRATVADLETAVDTALGGTGGILVSDDESVTIDLTDGTVSVDLAQIVNPDGVGLNDLPANTEILTPETIQALTSGVANALSKLVTPLTNAVDGLLDGTSLTISIPVSATATVPLVGTVIPVISGQATISGSLSQIAAGQGVIATNLALLPGLPIADTVLNPLLGQLTTTLTGTILPPVVAGLTDPALTIVDATDTAVQAAIEDAIETITDGVSPVLAAVVENIVSITVNVQPAGAGDLVGGSTVRALSLTLLPNLAGSSLASLDFASSSVSNVEPTAVPGTLLLDPDTARVGDTVDISGDDWNNAGDVTVTFTDEDSNVVGQPVVITPVDGTITGEFTVPEGVDPQTFLTATAVQEDASATATLTVVGEPTVIVEPDPVPPGDPITITGSGFLCGPVTVTISDGDEVLETIEDIPVDDLGNWSTTYTVPADTEATQLTISATGPAGCGEDETPVDIDQPETVALTPGEVRGGDVITIDGTGWEGDGPVTVVFTDADDQPIGEPVVIDPVDGVIDGTFTVPPGTPAGPITGTATRDDDSAEDTVQLFGTATVSIDPATIRAGGTVDIDGTGWLPNGGDVTVTFTDGPTPVGSPVVISDITPEGVIAGTFTVPEGTDAATLTATAVQGDATALDTLVVAPEPSIVLDPTTARPGDAVDVDGAGWADGTVTVIFTDGGVQVGDALTLPVTAGVISGTYTVPADVDAGTLIATATQGEDEATAELEITLAPTVSASPPQLHGGDSVTIGGSGWGTTPVVVTITDGADETVGTPVTITPVDGVLTGTYLIPEGTDVGELTVTATDGADTAEDTVEIVADPTVTVEPDPADPSQQVLIAGTGFLCGPVTVTISDGSTTLDTLEDLPVIDGAWSVFWTVPLDVAADTLTITAVATGECGDEGETDVEVDLVETLTATPAFVEVGDQVTVAGTGWADGIVSITATDSDGTDVGLFTATSTDAAFSTTFTVPPNADLGALEFEATQGESAETATVTVVSIPAGPATLIVSPSAVEPGTSVALDGEGWDPTAGPVTVTFTDAAGVAIGAPVVVLVSLDGGLIRGSFTVPEDLDAPQVLIATGVQGARQATDTLEVREADLPVIRLGGPTRIEVAVEISRDAYPFGTRTVFVASAATFPDALSAAPAAAQLDAPILLTWQDSVPAVVQQELDRIEPDRIIVVGGPNTIAPSTYQTLAGYAPSIERIGGADRFEVSQNIAEWAFPSADTAYIASGLTFPDALTAGAAAGAAGAPMILTHGSQPWPGVLDTLEELGVEDVFVAGGPVTIPQSNITAIENAGFDVVQRFGGATRYDVGVNVAQQFDGPTDRIYVATGVRFPDALAGSAIAGAQGHPVFVSPVTCLWQDIPGEIARLGGPQVVLLGGTASLNEDVFDLQTC